MDNVFVFIVLIAFMSFSQFLGIVLYERVQRLLKAGYKPKAELDFSNVSFNVSDLKL